MPTEVQLDFQLVTSARHPVPVTGVGQRQLLGGAAGQPRMGVPEGDEIGDHRPSLAARQPGGVIRELGTDGVVPAEPILLHPGEPALGAVVDRRDAAHGQQDRQRDRHQVRPTRSAIRATS